MKIIKMLGIQDRMQTSSLFIVTLNIKKHLFVDR